MSPLVTKYIDRLTKPVCQVWCLVPSLVAGACYSKRSPSDRPRDGSSPFHQRSVNIQDHSIHHRNFEIPGIVVRLSFSESENRQLLSGCSRIWTIVGVHACPWHPGFHEGYKNACWRWKNRADDFLQNSLLCRFWLSYRIPLTGVLYNITLFYAISKTAQF